MEIHLASQGDIDDILANDIWIKADILLDKIQHEQVYVLKDDSKFIGWMRWGLFWDSVPFLFMLHILDDYKERGYGTKAMLFWEKQMKSKGYQIIFTSTAQTETAQHFYVKLGYKAIGSFTIATEPLEIIFSKNI